jgi:phosphatidylglycerophosphate synthase
MRFSEKIKEARQIAQTPRIIAGEDWYSQLFTRSFTIYLSYPLWKLKISANSITVLMGIVCLLGSICIVFDNIWLVLLGTLLWHLWYILDCVDGEVARLSKKTSLLGVYIDRLTHIFVNPTMPLAFGLNIFNRERTISNAVCAVLVYSAFIWRFEILKMREKGDQENISFKKVQYNKKSVLGTLRLIISLFFTPSGQMIVLPIVLIVGYFINSNFSTHSLHIYTILFLSYIVFLTIRELIAVHELDKGKQD